MVVNLRISGIERHFGLWLDLVFGMSMGLQVGYQLDLLDYQQQVVEC